MGIFEKNKMMIILFFIVLFLLCFIMSVKATEGLNLKKIETLEDGVIIEISANKKIEIVYLYKKGDNGQYSRFYVDSNVNSFSKQYFISKYRLSTDEMSKLKAIAVLEDGSSLSSEIEMEKLPIQPEPTVTSTVTFTPTPSVSPSTSPTVTTTTSPSTSPVISPTPSATPIVDSEKITLNKTSAKLALNDNKTLQLKATLKNAKSGTKLTWSTDNKNIATVSSDGKVTAVGTGTTTIKVKTASGKTASCKIIVTASTGKIEVLFVGNSKTYVNDIPSKFKNLAKKGGYTVNISTATKGGRTLKYLTTKSNNSTDKLTGKNNYNTITGKAYDYVIMQEQSDTYINDYDTFLSGATKLKNLVQKNNKNTKLFVRQCWAYKSSSTSIREKGYTNARKVASKIGASLIYDGKSIYKAKSSTNMSMFVDNVHQSKEGAYLSACCVYSAVFNKSPVNLGYYGGISSANAKKLKMIAWNIYSSNK